MLIEDNQSNLRPQAEIPTKEGVAVLQLSYNL